MSKAVTNEEVEDVLSSIRRLVSEDKRPLAGFRSSAAEPQVSAPDATPENDEPDHFVLTPALRVAHSNDAGKADDGLAESDADDGPLDLGSVARETWMQPETQQELIAPDVVTNDDLDALVHKAVEAETHGDEQVDSDDLVDGDYTDESYWDVEEDPRHEEVVLDAEPEDVAHADRFEWVMDRSEVDADSDVSSEDGHIDDAEFDDVELESELANDDAVEDAQEDDTPSKQAFFEPAADDLEDGPVSRIPLTAKIAALEAAVSEIAHDWEPDGDEMDTLAATAAPVMAWEDDVDLDANGAPIRDDDGVTEVAETREVLDDKTAEEAATVTDSIDADKDAKAPQIGAGFGVDDQLMDEEALRDLVGEIVRAELQGALGERITRNVRKLVRREIHRALTAQEME